MFKICTTWFSIPKFCIWFTGRRENTDSQYSVSGWCVLVAQKNIGRRQNSYGMERREDHRLFILWRWWQQSSPKRRNVRIKLTISLLCLGSYLAACHSPEPASTVSKCSWRWAQKASETCRAILQLQINILPSCITLVLLYIYIYILTVFFGCLNAGRWDRLEIQ